MSGVIDFSSVYKLIADCNRLTESAAWRFTLSQEEIQGEIIRLNQEQLYEDGITGTGEFVTNLFTGSSSYSPYTIEVNKLPFGLPYDRITLFQTGKFYATFYVSYTDTTFTIKADGDKGDKNLFDIYGEDIKGLTEHNILHGVKPLMLKYYAEYIKKTLFPDR